MSRHAVKVGDHCWECACGQTVANHSLLIEHIARTEYDARPERDERPVAMCAKRVKGPDGTYGFCELAAAHDRLGVPCQAAAMSAPPPPTDFGPRRK